MFYQKGLLFYSCTPQPTEFGPLPDVLLMCNDESGGDPWGHTLWIILQSVIFFVEKYQFSKQSVRGDNVFVLYWQAIWIIKLTSNWMKVSNVKLWVANDLLFFRQARCPAVHLVNSTSGGSQKLNFQFRHWSISSTWQDCGSLRVMLTRRWILTRNNTTQLRNIFFFFDTVHIRFFFSLQNKFAFKFAWDFHQPFKTFATVSLAQLLHKVQSKLEL